VRTITQTALSGYELLNDPLLNKGTAFTAAERDQFDLHGLLPPHVTTLDLQAERRLEAFRGLGTDLQKYIFLRGLQDTNETLFYALLTRNIAEMMPIVYTPTVGLGCQQFSRIFRKPRGLFLSFPLQDRISHILSNPRFNDVEAIVVSDGERILGLGDQGAGGMGIPIGKLSLYTACAGLHPSTTLPVLLDVGTDNRALLEDPLYIGWRQERFRGADYDNFIGAFVDAVKQRWPHILLQWEDFALANANRLLARYREQLCTFNDDIQGTAAIAVGALLSAINVTGLPITEQRIAVLGAGTAGTGICTLLVRAMTNAGMTEKDARSRFYLVDRQGLLTEDTKGLQPFQAVFSQKRERIAEWTLSSGGPIGLAEVVANARPSVLIGTSGQACAFSEPVVRAMAQHTRRPIIFPLSNPTERSEATPQDLLAWTKDRAVVGTGSPFPPIVRGGQSFRIDQVNNAYVFPGVGLGAIAVRARRISERMFLAAARAAACRIASHRPSSSDCGGRAGCSRRTCR
jgi:malate dehydrogenase (oxaloacetate-decarboxylating)